MYISALINGCNQLGCLFWPLGIWLDKNVQLPLDDSVALRVIANYVALDNIAH